LVLDYYRRYQVPILITETSALPPATARTRWLAESVAAVKYLRGRGVPVLGYTWFPMFTMIDWRYRHGRGPVDQYRIELGLYKLGAREGDPRWIATPLVEQYQSYIRHPADTIGPLVLSAP